MPRLFHHSLHFEYTLIPKGMKTLYFAHLLRGAAEQFAGLFVPLFLFSLGQRSVIWDAVPEFFALTNLQRGILYICLYFILYRVVTLVTIFPFSRIIKLFGLTKSMALGNVVRIAYYISLFLAQTNEAYILLSAILGGIEVVFYWPAYFTQFALRADIQSIGRNVGNLSFLDKLLRALLPLFGGTTIAVLGYGANQLIAVVVILAATVLLLLTRETLCSYVATMKEFFSWMKKQSFRKAQLGFIGRYIDDSAFILWTVYAFVFFGTAERVGYIFSVVLFISLVISYFMGWYLGKHRGRRLLYLSGSVLSAAWVLRIFVRDVWHFVAVDVTDRLAVGVYQPIFDTFFLRFSRERAVFHFHIYRELTVSAGAIMFWLVMAMVFLLPFQWSGLFIVASIGVLISLYIGRGDEHG